MGNNHIVLAILYIVHILSTAAYAAGLFYQLKNHEVSLSSYDRLGWLWILLMAITGMFQMSASPSYAGLLQINSVWAVALAIKHGLIIILILLMGIQTFVLLPTLQREQWGKSRNELSAEGSTRTAHFREIGLRVQGVLFILILIATGVARAG